MNCKKITENQRKKENSRKGRKEGKESSKEEGTNSQCDIWNRSKKAVSYRFCDFMLFGFCVTMELVRVFHPTPVPQTAERNLTWVTLRKLAGVRGALSTLNSPVACRHRMSKWLTKNHPISLPSTQGVWPSNLSSFHRSSRSQVKQAGGICFSKTLTQLSATKITWAERNPSARLVPVKVPFQRARGPGGHILPVWSQGAQDKTCHSVCV